MIDWGAVVLGPCMAIFGEPVTYTPAGGQDQQITGVFDRAYLEMLPLGGGRGMEPLGFGSGGNITAARPVLGVQLSQFAAPPKQNDRLVVHGITYSVAEVQDDGHGWAKLRLNKAPV